MTRRSNISSALLVLGLLIGGCASKPAEVAPQATTALDGMRSQLLTAKTQVQEAANAARDLLEQPRADVTPQMQRLNTSVNALNGTREATRTQAEAYNQKTQEYFAKWDETLKTMSDETAERGEKRMMLAKDSIARLRQDGSDIRYNLNPFMAEINEANKYLATDTTKAGLDAVRPKLQSAVKRAPDISRAIDKTIADINAIRAGK